VEPRVAEEKISILLGEGRPLERGVSKRKGEKEMKVADFV